MGTASEARLAVEIKITTQVHKSDLSGLIAFCEEHPKVTAIVVSQDDRERKIMVADNTYITVISWRLFLEKLWADSII